MEEDKEQHSETTRDVLRDALEAVSRHEAPTPREVLQYLIRMECARAGLPKPDFDCFPASDVIRQVLD